VIANYFFGLAVWYGGDPIRTAEFMHAVIALLKDAPAGERFGLASPAAVTARCWLAAAPAGLGEFSQAFGGSEHRLRIRHTRTHPLGEVLARWGFGYVHLRHGDFAQAAHVLEPALALCQTTGIRSTLPFMASSLGAAYLRSGRAADALMLLEEAADAFTAM